MNPSLKIWLIYSTIGLILSIVITTLFDAMPSLRFISNEGVVFGIMASLMGTVIQKLSRDQPND